MWHICYDNILRIITFHIAYYDTRLYKPLMTTTSPVSIWYFSPYVVSYTRIVETKLTSWRLLEIYKKQMRNDL